MFHGGMGCKTLIFHQTLRYPLNPNLLIFFRNPNPSFLRFFAFQSIFISSLLKTLTCTINLSSVIISNKNPNPKSFISNINPNPNHLNCRFHSYRSFSNPSSAISPSSSKTLIFCKNGNFKFQSFSSYSRSKGTLMSGREQKSLNFRRDPKPNSRICRRNPNLDPNLDEFNEVIELIRREVDMELKLKEMNLGLSHDSVIEILRHLNDHEVSALRFFNWIRESEFSFIINSEIFNLIIDNLGRLEDYESMLVLLKELSSKGHCLSGRAFAFLNFRDRVRVRDSVERLVEALNESSGSCRSSGIYALITVLCALNSFDLAILVMDRTSRKTSYYNVVIAAKCRTGDFRESQHVFDEMKSFGCDPNTKSYNYVLGCLCKKERIAEACELLEAMEKLGYLPDAVTFEVIVFHACRLRRMDFAVEFLDRMMSEGLQPRISMHSAFIKAYFWFGRQRDAHKYVVDMIVKDSCSANMNYSLLARLFQDSGRVVEAREILIEMIEKGLKPNFPVYMKVMKGLYNLGMRDLAADLKTRFSKFNSNREVG